MRRRDEMQHDRSKDTMASCDDESREGKQGRGAARQHNNQEPNKAGVMRCVRGRNATTRQYNETTRRRVVTTCRVNVTMQRSATWRGDAAERRNGTMRTTRHSTAMQQPTEQVDTERGNDATTRGEDDATRGERRRRRRYFFCIHIVFRGGYCSYLPKYYIPRQQKVVRHVSGARKCWPRHACRVQISDKLTRRRHVADISS